MQSLAISGKVRTVLGKRGVMGYKRMTIRKDGKEGQRKTDVVIFNKSKIPKESKNCVSPWEGVTIPLHIFEML